MSGNIKIELTVNTPGALLAREIAASANPKKAVAQLVNLLQGTVNEGGQISVAIQEVTSSAAVANVAFVAVSASAGDVIVVGSERLVAVAGTAVAASGQWTTSGTNANVAASFRDAVNAYLLPKKVAFASSSAANCFLTSSLLGAQGNVLALSTSNTNGATISATTFLSGVDANTGGRSRFTFSSQPATGSKVSIGAAELFFVSGVAASASQVPHGANLTATTTNFINTINRYSFLQGVVTASLVAGTTSSVDLVFTGYPRKAGLHIAVALSGTTNATVSEANLAEEYNRLTVSSSNYLGARSYQLGSTNTKY